MTTTSKANTLTPRRARHFVSSILGDVVIYVDALEVLRIEDGTKAGRSDTEGTLDLASHLALEAPPAQTRRALVISNDTRGLRRLLIGDRTKVERVEDRALHKVPPFIAELGARAGIECVLATEDRLGFVLDLSRLATSVSRGEAH